MYMITMLCIDAQGNYNFYGRHPGDFIKVKVPKSQKNSDHLLKFEASPDQYIETEMVIAAIVSRRACNRRKISDSGSMENSAFHYNDKQPDAGEF